jgi:hypothetical protein
MTKDAARFPSKGIRAGYNLSDYRCVSLRLTGREWGILRQALRDLDCGKLVDDPELLTKMRKDIVWLEKKIEAKMHGEKVPKKR